MRPPVHPLPGKEANIAAIEIQGGSRAGEKIELKKLPANIGKRRKSAILLRESGVAYDHARILEKGGAFFVEDLSGRGTEVDGKALSKGAQAQLAAESTIQIGSVALRFILAAAAPVKEEPAEKPTSAKAEKRSDARDSRRRARELRRQQREAARKKRQEAVAKPEEAAPLAPAEKTGRSAERRRDRRRQKAPEPEKPVAEEAEAEEEREEESPLKPPRRRAKADDSMSRSLVSLEREIKDLKDMLERRDAVISELREELVQEKRSVMQARRDNTHKVRAEELEAESTKLRRKLAETDDENFALKERLESLESRLKSNLDAGSIIEADRQEVLERMRAKREGERQEAAERIQAVEARADMLQEELEDLKIEFQELENQYEALAMAEDEHLEKAAWLSGRVSDLEKDREERVRLAVREVEDRLRQMTATNDELRRLLGEFERRIEELDAAV